MFSSISCGTGVAAPISEGEDVMSVRFAIARSWKRPNVPGVRLLTKIKIRGNLEYGGEIGKSQEVRRPRPGRRQVFFADEGSVSGIVRVIQTYRLRDSDMDNTDDTMRHTPLRSMLDESGGYRVQKGNRRVRFVDLTPSSTLTYYAWLVQTPATLSYGTCQKAVAAGTTMELNTTPTYGETLYQADYYNREEFCVVSGTNDALGAYREVTDFAAASGTCTCTFADSKTIAATDIYSSVLSLTSCTWEALYARTAARIARFYRTIPSEIRRELREEAKALSNTVLHLLQEPQPGMVLRPRVVAALLH